MSDVFRVNVKIDVGIDSVLDNWNNLIHDDKVMLEVYNKFAQMCEPYVPMYEGALAQTTEITPKYIRWTQPYAHYQYIGEVYGPNIPITDRDGNVVGWFSPPGEKKHPTGHAIQYSKERHPLASKEWDKAMMADRGEEFAQAVKLILVERARELYG